MLCWTLSSRKICGTLNIPRHWIWVMSLKIIKNISKIWKIGCEWGLWFSRSTTCQQVRREWFLASWGNMNSVSISSQPLQPLFAASVSLTNNATVSKGSLCPPRWNVFFILTGLLARQRGSPRKALAEQPKTAASASLHDLTPHRKQATYLHRCQTTALNLKETQMFSPASV